MIYKKPGVRFPDQIRYHQCFEYMFVFSKGKPKTSNLIKDRKNLSYNKDKKWAKIKNKREFDDGYVVCDSFKFSLEEFGARYNIWDITLEQSKPGNVSEWNWHPAIFPSNLANGHIITWSDKGNTVLDPFSGSGTTAIQAKKTKRNYIGIEINKEYVEKSIKRIESYDIPINKIEDENGTISEFIEF
jgi:site-specific DNA-methyltransferase (adenine-specific)